MMSATSTTIRVSEKRKKELLNVQAALQQAQQSEKPKRVTMDETLHHLITQFSKEGESST